MVRFDQALDWARDFIQYVQNFLLEWILGTTGAVGWDERFRSYQFIQLPIGPYQVRKAIFATRQG